MSKSSLYGCLVLPFTSFCLMVKQITPGLVSRSPFRLDPVPFWHGFNISEHFTVLYFEII